MFWLEQLCEKWALCKFNKTMFVLTVTTGSVGTRLKWQHHNNMGGGGSLLCLLFFAVVTQRKLAALLLCVVAFPVHHTLLLDNCLKHTQSFNLCVIDSLEMFPPQPLICDQFNHYVMTSHTRFGFNIRHTQTHTLPADGSGPAPDLHYVVCFWSRDVLQRLTSTELKLQGEVTGGTWFKTGSDLRPSGGGGGRPSARCRPAARQSTHRRVGRAPITCSIDALHSRFIKTSWWDWCPQTNQSAQIHGRKWPTHHFLLSDSRVTQQEAERRIQDVDHPNEHHEAGKPHRLDQSAPCGRAWNNGQTVQTSSTHLLNTVRVAVHCERVWACYLLQTPCRAPRQQSHRRCHRRRRDGCPQGSPWWPSWRSRPYLKVSPQLRVIKRPTACLPTPTAKIQCYL